MKPLSPLFTIQQISQKCDVPKSTLRFWEKRLGPLFSPIRSPGGHQMRQQIVSFMTLFPHLKDGGVYIIEDLHTSYRADYQAGLRQPGTAMEHLKGLVDCLNWWSYKESADWMDYHLESVHFYDSVCVLVKKAHDRPIPITKP